MKILHLVTMTALGTGLWAQNGWKVIAWNDLGMHCVDGKDYSIYSILPPFNTFHAQVVNGSGRLVKTGVTLSYQAVADPAGSMNRTSVGKSNFWQFSKLLYGAALTADMGLAGFAMPGAKITAQRMRFDSPFAWFTGEGVPILPYDDKGVKNYYPMMRVTARSSTGTALAFTDIVLPVSDEMNCSACHSSGSTSTARPAAGWAFLSDPEKDYKWNVLRLHDERQAGNPAYRNALAAVGLNLAGLAATVEGGRPVLCASCHGSNALPGTGQAGIAPLTRAIHSRHANVVDPTNFLTLDALNNRSACYRCHPGSETKCLRGAMGNATEKDGSMTMQCQSCHGNMSAVGKSTRQGWFQEPSCQNCHTGTAVKNNGQIRYTDAFVGGAPRVAVDRTFATNANTPAAGLDLYRFSKGHGGLQCSACHGSTHAEYPSSHVNDNLQSIKLQGYAGTVAECKACHGTAELKTVTGGPHGLHPIGQNWVDKHEDAAERDAGQCRTCHGADYRGTVLSAAKTARTFKTEWGTKKFAKGTPIGCFQCHNGPRGE